MITFFISSVLCIVPWEGDDRNWIRRLENAVRQPIADAVILQSEVKLRNAQRKGSIMKLDTKALAITSGLLWSGAVLTVGLLNMAKPNYGKRFLRVIGSIYPGYHATPNAKDVATGTAYAMVDGLVGGAIFAALYSSVETHTNQEYVSSKAA